VKKGSSKSLMALAATGLLALGGLAAAQDDQAYRIYVSNEYGAGITVLDGESYEQINYIDITGRPGEVRPRGMGVSPDGSVIYVAVSDFFPVLETPEDKLVAIDVETGEVTLEISAGGNPERLFVSPDGTQVWAALEAIAQGGGYYTETGEEIATFRTGVEPEGVAVSPDGRYVYLSAEATHTTTIFDIENLETVKHLLVGNRPREVRFSPDGAWAYVSAEIGGTVSVIDTELQEVVDTVSLGLDSRPVEMAVSPAGDRLYVAGGGTNAVYVISIPEHELITTITENMGRRPWGITITPDGERVFTANGLSDSISVIDTECLCVVENIEVGRGPHSVEVGVVPNDQ